MVPRSLPKQLSNQHPNLHRFGSQLGSILGGFWEPSWTQVGTKSLQKLVQKMIKKMITFWIALGSDFDRFCPPTWHPRGGPRNHFSMFFGLLGPSSGQHGSKTPPKRLPGPPNTLILKDLGPHLHGIWPPSWCIWAPSWRMLAPSSQAVD